MEEVKNELGNNSLQIAKEVYQSFQKYPWPGNLRELRNVIRRSALLSSTDNSIIQPAHLPHEVLYPPQNDFTTEKEGLKAAQHEAEAKVIIEALRDTNGNKSKAAKLLEIDRKTLYNKLKLFNIE